MARSALSQISTLHSLRSAWTFLNKQTKRRSRENAGVDDQSINHFAQNVERNLISIQAEINSPVTYEFQPLRAHLIPKHKGKLRVICVPTVRDRIVQRAALDYLSDGDKCKLLNAVSYGFIRDRGVKKAVNRAKNLRKKKPWAYKTDITSFFDTVNRTLLEKAINRYVRSTTLHALLVSATKCEIREPRPHRQKTIKKQGVEEGVGIRQGMPLSPFLTNLLLRDFDRSAEAAGLRMIRYADDLIIFASSEDACLKIHQFCKEELQKLQLEVPDIGHDSKTIIYSPDTAAEFLGVGLKREGPGYSVQVLKNQLTEIRARILHLSDMEHLRNEDITLSRLTRRLEGTIAGYVGAYDYCDNIEDVEKKLVEWKRDVLKRVFSNGLGIDLAKLSDDQLAFLELSEKTK